MIELKLKEVNQWKEMLIPYKFAADRLGMIITHINEEAMHIYNYTPIEHVKKRIKTPESIINKLQRKSLPVSFQSAKHQLFDIVGIRIICSFIGDIYDLYEILKQRKEFKIIQCKDYIENPKPNGYMSLHLIIEMPIMLSEGEEIVYAEIQLRTLGMDFWASLEHKIFYKFEKDIPNSLKDELMEAAQMTYMLDSKMKRLNDEIVKLK